jgi:transmembrane sensor
MTRDAPAANAEDQAADWYVRLNADSVSPTDQGEFERWLLGHAEHRRAWQRIIDAVGAVDRAGGHPAVRAMVAEGLADDRGHRRRHWGALAIAASLALVVGVAVVVETPAWRQDRPHDQEFATTFGKSQVVPLADGSRMTLDAASRVRVSPPGDTRRVAVLDGRAFFKVAKDPAHPFVVSAGGNSVTALGTAFSVETAPSRFSVALVEGSVKVTMPAEHRSSILKAGEMLVKDAQGVHILPGKAAADTSWLHGELTFDEMPLAQVVAEMNRYSRRRIVLSDPALGDKTFSGVLKTDGADALADALKGYRVARVARSDAHEMVLAPY